MSKSYLPAVKPSVVEIKGQKFQQASAFVTEAGKPYQMLAKDRKLFAALTHAAFIYAGLVSHSSAKAAPVKAKGGNFGLWAAIVGPTARNYWVGGDRVKDGEITVSGLNTLSARIRGEARGYNTDMESVEKLYGLLANGGEIEVAGQKVKFAATAKVSKPVTASKTTAPASKTADAVKRVKAAANKAASKTAAKPTTKRPVKTKVKTDA